MFGSYKTLLGAAFAAMVIGSPVGCQKDDAGSGRTMADPDEAVYDPRTAAASQDAGLEQLDLGQDWSQRTGEAERSGTEAAQGQAALGGTPSGHQSFWTVVLGTYDHDNARTAATNMLRQLRQMDPVFSEARVHETSQGAMVILGRFDSPDDAAAQQTLHTVKDVTYRGRTLLPKAMLSRIKPNVDPRQRSPLDLLSVRREYPNADPLYTLDVAMWSDFGSGEMSWQEIRRKTIAYARELRGKGYQAYFYLDRDQRIGQVTVGVWGGQAVDRRTGFLHSEVRQLLEQFPVRRVNGEPLREPVDRDNPNRGTRVQKPQLVLVPEL